MDPALFGDGSDGVSTIASDTVLAAGSASSKQFSSLTVNSGVNLTTAGEILIIRVTGTLTINGTIHVDGKGSLGGAANGLNTTGSTGTDGKAGFAFVVGSAGHGGGPNPPDDYGNPGGGGGAFLGIGGAGGVQYGPVSQPGLVSNNASGMLPHLQAKATASLAYLTGAGGGGGGGRPSVPNGGNGGNGGGCLLLLASNIVIGASGIVSANGTNGIYAGGGGSGGYVALSYGTLTNTGVIRANGGSGNGGTGGVNTTPNAPPVDGNGNGGSSGVIRMLHYP